MKKLTMLEMGRINTEQFKAADKMPLIIILDNIRSLNNIGSVFRTCDAFRVEAIYLCGISATPPSAEIHKTALGAEESVAWQYFEDTHEAVRQLQQRGYKVMAIEQCQGSVMLDQWAPSYKVEKFEKFERFESLKGTPQTLQTLQTSQTLQTPETPETPETLKPETPPYQGYAVVMGNEVKGVQQSVVDMCDGCIEIPQYGTKHSLNVSVTTGIVIWDFFKAFEQVAHF